MTSAIAVVGMACRYPEASGPTELWENVLAQRRAFRRIPPERLRAADYISADRHDPERTYLTQAAVLEGYRFDRVRFRVAGETFRSADLAHWLALEVAADALSDGGFPDGEGLPRETTGVLIGNSLTGEFSRANAMRLRWPYVRRVTEAVLREDGWAPAGIRGLWPRMEALYKAPFPAVGGETLAGGLSNTIAGRICNHFDLKGGGYTVDGACASSLLAVANACSALAAGDVDVVLAGGVDLSLDPFELVGFARVGALAPEEMRVYDARSAGFWPGEGCGVVVLMRYADAAAQRRPIYAVIRGWGVSSDGSGGLTRPEFEGQSLALQRAYRRAGFGPESVGYFEGHGTGTEVGDAVELRVLSHARRASDADAPPAAVGSVKANIGHTKAAAGVAGLIKAVMALHTQTLPPTTGCEEPHPELQGAAPALRVLGSPEPWAAEAPLRAGVSAMGFGGINTHLTLEGLAAERRIRLDERTRVLGRSPQDAEVFLLGGRGVEDLLRQAERLMGFAAALSRSEVADLAAHLQGTLGPVDRRAAVIASTADELHRNLGVLRDWIGAGADRRIDARAGVFLGESGAPPRIGFLFPGQGSPAHLDGGALRRRFPSVDGLYAGAGLPAAADGVATEVAQPAIVTASMAGLMVLSALGIEATVGIGHSLGELTALHWAGAMDAEALLRLATVRGRAMAHLGSPTGAMASISAGRDVTDTLLAGLPIVIAGVNSPLRTVVSGPADAVAEVAERARARGIAAQRLPVSHAFHSPLVAAATEPLAEHLAKEPLHPLRKRVSSTVTGSPLDRETDLPSLLEQQVTSPVLFLDAVQSVLSEVDLWLEVGPGHTLTVLSGECGGTPSVPLDAGGPSLRGVLAAVGAAFAFGAPVRSDALFADRALRPFDLAWEPYFLSNPCELAPVGSTESAPSDVQAESPASRSASELAGNETVEPGRSTTAADGLVPEQNAAAGGSDPREVVRRLVAAKAELPKSAIHDEHHLLGDLHLNSITVGQIAAEAARCLGLAPPVAPMEYATATVAEVARALAELRDSGEMPEEDSEAVPAGVAAWVRAFTTEWVERPLPRYPASPGTGEWQILAPDDHPLADPLRTVFAARGPGSGVLVCLPSDSDERHLCLLLEGARAVLRETGPTRFVLVQHDGGGAAFARTLSWEAPSAPVCVVNVPEEAANADAVEWILAETTAAEAFVEVRFDAHGRRYEPVLRVFPIEHAPPEPVLGADDVLLATGGGKGITAECALAVARTAGARLAILGRSHPEADPGLGANLERIGSAGVRYHYVAADITDAAAVRGAIREFERALGPITAVLHGAAVNEPRLLRSLDEAAILRTLAPKVQGARNVLAALDLERLRLFVGFGSIIARTGLAGAADYALANEWLTRLIERYRAQCPACRWLALEWSIWSDVGMGARLGRVDALARSGISPISPDQGVAVLGELLARRLPTSSLVLSGRFGQPSTLRAEARELPLLRFLERPRIHYPGIELIAETDLSLETDPYLADHALDGEYLLPAVIGLEAMAQTAIGLVGAAVLPVFEEVRLDRPVVVPAAGSVRLRVAALAHDPGRVEVVLRSEETGFQVDHFRAECMFRPAPPDPSTWPPDPEGTEELEGEKLDPGRDLYGSILFHAGRFRRLAGYRRLRARECVAAISPDGSASWFGRNLPRTLLLGDPAARDAAIHAIQACIPHALILPVGVRRITPGALSAVGTYSVRARETAQRGDEFVYDLEVVDAEGTVVERWDGLRLRRVAGTARRHGWVTSLLAPYLERRMGELVQGSAVSFALTRNGGGDRRSRSERAIRQALGTGHHVHRRPDGKPELADAPVAVSAAHAADLTLAVAGPGPLGCDMEPIVQRPRSVWRDLLGALRLELAGTIARETGEDEATAATRVWTAAECLKKAGLPCDAPLVLERCETDGWVLLRAGADRIATGALRVGDDAVGHAVGILVGGSSAGTRYYEYRHTVGFEETSLIGNVYYANHLLWQGRCREMFLREHAPGILEELSRGLALVTTRVSCDYLGEISAFDEVVIRMRLGALAQSRITMLFEYWRRNGENQELVARGEQEVACLRREGSQLLGTPVPEPLRNALRPYAAG